jgi:hypothetical protein
LGAFFERGAPKTFFQNKNLCTYAGQLPLAGRCQCAANLGSSVLYCLPQDLANGYVFSWIEVELSAFSEAQPHPAHAALLSQFKLGQVSHFSQFLDVHLDVSPSLGIPQGMAEVPKMTEDRCRSRGKAATLLQGYRCRLERGGDKKEELWSPCWGGRGEITEELISYYE